MCGRTATVATYRQYYETFLVSDEPPEGGLERYNLPFSYYGKKADTNSIVWECLPTVRSAEGKRIFEMMIWKLIPHWAQGKLPEYTSHNCRVKAEENFATSINKKSTFRSAWNNNQRCLIPVSWFYEWSSHTKPKQPYLIKDINEPFLSLAGIWDISTTPQGLSRTSCAIFTTEANELIDQLGHNTSPVIMHEGDYDTWLAGNKHDAEKLLKPYPSDTLEALPMPLSLNNPKFDSSELIALDS